MNLHRVLFARKEIRLAVPVFITHICPTFVVRDSEAIICSKRSHPKPPIVPVDVQAVELRRGFRSMANRNSNLYDRNRIAFRETSSRILSKLLCTSQT